jgi:hypothetical protein
MGSPGSAKTIEKIRSVVPSRTGTTMRRRRIQ